MKEKITLFIALSFLVGLTVYKKSINTDIELASNIKIENDENAINEPNSLANEAEQLEDYLNCDPEKINTDILQFSEAFKYYRNCNHDTFIWNGVEYTTILKSEINDKLEENHESLTKKMDLVSK
tara:strand:+ start:280 stop:654 length:375 start_codon:yes stop_codon:yes gene_type:complete